jgi:SAM-dependent methyltransferase
MPTWPEIWRARGLAATDANRTADPNTIALRLNGYDSPTAEAVSPADFTDYARVWAEQVGCTESHSIYEVGCGSGSFLAALCAGIECRDVAGCDLSASLIEAGHALFPFLSLEVAEGLSFPTRPRVDHVVSFGVFLYFPALDYADAVVRRMQDKAIRSVSILDVPDAALRARAEVYRRSSWGPDDYARRYTGLDHLYFNRTWFLERFSSNRWSVEISQQELANYGNGCCRFNVVARSLH